MGGQDSYSRKKAQDLTSVAHEDSTIIQLQSDAPRVGLRRKLDNPESASATGLQSKPGEPRRNRRDRVVNRRYLRKRLGPFELIERGDDRRGRQRVPGVG